MTDPFASSDASLIFDESLAFADVEPGEDQRWSTWPAITPSERGPEPWPDWVVTSAGALDTELGVLKTGKEADVFLIERAVPDSPERARCWPPSAIAAPSTAASTAPAPIPRAGR